MKELNETTKLMESSHYKDRFIAEYWQLKIRLDKLKDMLSKWDRGELTFTPIVPRFTYYYQVTAMQTYLNVLKERAAIEGVDLNEEE